MSKIKLSVNEIEKVHFIFSHCGLGSPLGVRGKVWKKRKNEIPPIEIVLYKKDEEEYISLTDMAKFKEKANKRDRFFKLK